jgi:hypothetical protein
MKKILVILNLIMMLTAGNAAWAERAMTKAEAMALLARSAAVKKKEANMLNWGTGYDITKINRVRMMPIINYVNAVPKRMPPDDRTIIEITASVDDPGGLKNISGVKADLSGLGKLANMTLVDTGLWGDSVAGDGIFTLQTTVNRDIPSGGKEVQVTAANKKGWLAVAKTTIDIAKDPVIVSVTAYPNRVTAGGTITLAVKVDNPGRIEDVSEVRVNLSEVGGGEVLLPFAQDDTFSDNITIGASTVPGVKRLPVRITNLAGGQSSGIIQIEVQ